MTDDRQSPYRPDPDPDLDPALDQTRRTLRRLHIEQQQRPDDAFVRRLEHSLMQHATHAPAHPPGIRGVIDRLGHGIQLRAPHTQRRSWVASALSVALLIALVGGTLAAVLRFGGTGGDQPTRTAMFAPSGTPEVTEQAPGVLWSVPFSAGERINTGGMVLAHGTIYRLGASPAFHGIEAINATDGSLLWSRETTWTTASMTNSTAKAQPIAADDERIYIFGSYNQVNALDADTGELIWSYNLGGGGLTLQIDNGELIVWDDSNLVTALNAATGDDLWALGAPDTENGFAATAPFVTDDLVLAIFGPGDLTAISRELGDVLWSYDDTFDPLNVSIAESDGSIILQGNNWETGNLETPRRNIVSALDAADGSVLWRQEIASDPITNIAVSGDSVFVIATDPERSAATPAPMASPRPEVDGVMWPNVVQALDIATGEVIWTSDQVSSFYRQLFTLPDGTVMALTNDAEIVGFAPESGDRVCSLYQLPGYPISTMLTDDTAIYLSLIDGTLLALEQTTLCAASSDGA